MCGIAGIIMAPGQAAPVVALEAMGAAMQHRGPDEAGTWTHQNIGLAHRRLSIIDLAGGQQPMHNAAGTTHVVFNGEIYNHLDLRRELAAEGAIFQTQCDTEILLHLYDAHGSAMLDKLEGMFAFALVDTRRNRVLLARDRLGQKPLVYFCSGGGLAFASELKALHHAPGFPDAINPQALHDYFTFHYVPSPQTIYAGVSKLPPAHYLEWELGATTPSPKPYWELPDATDQALSFRDAAEQLRKLLSQAVKRRLMADVPLGAFLSGGLDSACITSLMAQHMSRPVDTFTIGFAQPQYDERTQAAEAAGMIGTIHHVREADLQDFQVVQRVVENLGEPYADASVLPTGLLSAFARESVTVALSGDGADELFGGYERYQAMQLANRLDIVPQLLRNGALSGFARLLPAGRNERAFTSRLRRLCQVAAESPDHRYLGLLSRIDEAAKRTLYGPAIDPAAIHETRFGGLSATPPCDGAAAARLDLQTYLPGDILTKVDSASMAVSLEVRSPFLDRDVVEFACRLPWHFKQRHDLRKRVLLEACRDLVPAALQGRRKKGFGVPLCDWFRAGWKPLLQEILLDPRMADRGLVNPVTVEALIDDHATGRWDHSYTLWSLMVLGVWSHSQP